MSTSTTQKDHATQPGSQSTVDTLQSLVEKSGLCLGLIALAALTSTVSQLTLSPVYGSIPSSINHQAAISLTFVLGFLIHHVRGSDKQSSVLSWLPLLAALVPTAEYGALSLSEPLGVVGGAILAGLVSCHVLIVPSAYAVASIAQDIALPNIPLIPSAYIHAGVALVPFLIFERFFAGQLPEIIALSQIFTPADIQLVIPAALVLLCGSGPLIVVSTWSLLIVSYLFNPHGSGLYAETTLKRSLASHDWTLLARHWSNTGYISVLESRKEDYRVLRCDHSLLGGEWLVNHERRSQGWTDNETVYSVFTMLEAVRLVQTETQTTDSTAKALIVGLGIGTAPKAFIKHGIDTTIVELDPAVHAYASKYFSLPSNHTAVLADATVWMQQQTQKDDFERPTYDYIIHDVFTGGAEPLSLFTDTFLANLRALLSGDGVAAINYAGDLTTKLTRQVLNTIDLAFDRHCEVYSDDAARKDGSPEPFSNFIVFCRNSPGKIAFREPTNSDLLGSFSRQNYLLPRAEQRLEKTWADDGDILRSETIGSWRKAQEDSAMKHWTIMRTVLPARIWELY